MEHVLLAMFDSEQAALDARGRLLSAGFTEEAIAMAGGERPSTDPGGAATTQADASRTDDGRSGDARAVEPQREGPIARFFHSLFGTHQEPDPGHPAETYREAFRRGASGITVRVRSEAELDLAERVLNAAGAFDIDERSQQWRREGWTGRPAAAANPAAGTQTLPVIEEELEVGKRTVSRGAVRVFSHVVEAPVAGTVRLREERASVDRRPADRPATEADFAAFREGVLEIREMVEEAVVRKTARVVEEVEVSKHITEREEVVRDVLRKTQVDVGRVEPASKGSESTP